MNADAHVLPREDADAAAIVERRLGAEGVRLLNGVTIEHAERRGAEATLHYTHAGVAGRVDVDRVLVAAGRAPNVEDLGLDAAGVAYDGHGVTVNDHLQTTNPRIYAAGDVCSRFKFTHTADARRASSQNALFLGRRSDRPHVPWCTYTSPRSRTWASTRATPSSAGIAIDTITMPFTTSTAPARRRGGGLPPQVLAKGNDRILGATLVAAHAGDMITEMTLAMTASVGLGTLANVIHPYPTQAEAIHKAADA